uniref:TATA box-binding protein-like 1 n=1 Tax=Phlebotomus papatasi TaxID=29031 RepID=A0A1B0GMJ9_PHLPP
MFSLSGESGMATLLQQKSCMKTLANGGGNGATNATNTATSATTVILPHELVNMPGGQSSGQLVQEQQSPAQSFHQQQFTNFIQYSNYTNFTTPSGYQVANSSSIFSHPHQQQAVSQSIMTPTESNIVVISPESLANGTVSQSASLNPADIIEEDDGIEATDGEMIKAEDCESANGLKEEEPGVVEDEQEAEPEVDIVINNVVCSFSVRCHLNLREIALNGFNVEFRRENGMVTMKLRRPYTTASIWSSGKITCTGFSVRFNNFRVVNVLGTCSMPWGIKIVNFSEKYRKEASYEPELHPGVTYKLKTPKATLKIFSTGSITVTAGSVAHVQAAIEHIFPLVYEFRKARTQADATTASEVAAATTLDPISEICDEPMDQHSGKRRKKMKRPFGRTANDPSDNIMYVSDVEEFDMIPKKTNIK